MATNGRKVPMMSIIHQVVSKSYDDLRKLVETLHASDDSERKFKLNAYFKRTQVELIRLLVLLKWAENIPQIQNSNDLVQQLTTQSENFRVTGDHLFFLTRELFDPQGRPLRAPVYDMPSAVEVLTTGTYARLPSFIKKSTHEEIVIPKELRLTKELTPNIMDRLTQSIHVRFLSESLPEQYTSVNIEKGLLQLTVQGEFTALLTLRDSVALKAPWTVLKIIIHVQPKDEDYYVGSEIAYFITKAANDRQSNAKKPLTELYNVVHYFCTSLAVSILHKQAVALRERQKSAVMLRKIEYVKDPTVLTLRYWQAAPQPDVNGPADAQSSDFHVRVSIDEKTKMIQAKHFPEIIDSHHQIAHFNIDPAGVNLEGLLTSVASANTYSRLRSLQQFLIAANRVKPQILQNDSSQYLSISLFGSSRLMVFVNLFSGEFMLNTTAHISKDILSSSVDKLNKTPSSIVEISDELFRKSVIGFMQHLTPLYGVYCQSKPASLSLDVVGRFSSDALYVTFPSLGAVMEYTLIVDVDIDGVPVYSLMTFSENNIELRQFSKMQLTRRMTVKFNQDTGLVEVFEEKESEEEESGTGRTLPVVETNAVSGSSATPNKKRGKFSTNDAFSPKRKKMKLESKSNSSNSTNGDAMVVALDFDSEKDDERSLKTSFENILRHSETYARRFCIIDQFRSARIDYQQLEGPKGDSVAQFKDVFQIQFLHDPFLFETSRVILDRSSGWLLQFKEIRSLSPETISPLISDDRKISYDASRCLWSFEYRAFHTKSFAQFLTDFTGLGKLVQLLVQYKAAIAAKTLHVDRFHFFSLTPNKLSFVMPLDRNKSPESKLEDSRVHIEWTGSRYRVHLGSYFHVGTAATNSPLAPFLAHELTENEDMRVFFEAIFVTCQFTSQIGRLLIPRNPTQATSFLPGSVVIVPRGLHRVRFIFFDSYGLDVRFLAKSIITIEDAGTAPHDPTKLKPASAARLKRIPNLVGMLTEYEKKANEQISKQKEPQTSVQRRPTDTIGFTITQLQVPSNQPGQPPITTASVMTSHLKIQGIFLNLCSYIGSVQLFRNLIPLLRTEPGLDQIKETEQKVEFSTARFIVRISLIDNKLAVEITPGPGFSQHGDAAFQESEYKQYLPNYFKMKVASLPNQFRSDAAISFIRMLRLPTPLLRDIINTMKEIEKNQQRRVPGGPTPSTQTEIRCDLLLKQSVDLPTSPVVKIEDASQSFVFKLRMMNGNTTLFDLPLRYVWRSDQSHMPLTLRDVVAGDPRIDLFNKALLEINFSSSPVPNSNGLISRLVKQLTAFPLEELLAYAPRTQAQLSQH